MKEERKCARCGAVHPEAELIWFEDERYCPDCIREISVVCIHCGKRIWRTDNSGSDQLPLCEGCFESGYVTCICCGNVVCREDAMYDGGEPYCQVCYRREFESLCIRDYYYKPEPIFYGEADRYFGVELEVDEGGEYDGSAAEVIRIANQEAEHIYCKHDGSLDDGFEVVTHPMTLDYHSSGMPWEEVLEKLRKMGYLSHQANTCGLHVHVNRSSLGDDVVWQEGTIARILFFVEKHWEELLKFSRRTPRQLERWAARYGYRESPQDILDHAKGGGRNGRYSCVNLENRNTVEFRMFRGSLKWNTVIATLQMVNRICDVAFSLSDEEIRSMSWTTFVSGCREPELIRYLKERRIYINEPVETEEEL